MNLDGGESSLAGNEMETGMDFANRNGLLLRKESTSADEGGGMLYVFIELVLWSVLIRGKYLPA